MLLESSSMTPVPHGLSPWLYLMLTGSPPLPGDFQTLSSLSGTLTGTHAGAEVKSGGKGPGRESLSIEETALLRPSQKAKAQGGRGRNEGAIFSLWM